MSGVILTFLQGKYPLGISYDAFNPAVTNDLKNLMRSIYGMYFSTIKMMSMHHRSYMLVDDNAESNNTLDVENVAERVISL